MKRAVPLARVVRAAVGSAAPGPLATTVVTVTPLWLTGLPLASCSWSTGCWARATPLCALLDGSVVIVSFAAAPAVAVAVKVTGLPVSPLAVAGKGLVPGAVLCVHDVTAAMPPPFVPKPVGVTL